MDWLIRMFQDLMKLFQGGSVIDDKPSNIQPVDKTPVVGNASKKVDFDKKTMMILGQLHPVMAEKTKQLLIAAEEAGLKVGLFEGYRTFERSAELYAQGRDANGLVVDKSKVVTNSKPGYSWHNYGLACLDEETEILTDAGWRGFRNFKLGTQVMAFKDGFLKYEESVAFVIKSYRGFMQEIHPSGWNLLVTPDHKMVVKRRGRKNERWFYTRADSLIPSDAIPLGGEFIGSCMLDYPFKNVVSSKDWWSFMGWWLSEGFACGVIDGVKKIHNGRYCVGICQSVENKKNREEIYGLLKRLPWKFWSDGKKDFTTHSKELWEKLFPLGSSVSKRMPRYLLNAPKEELSVLLDSLIKGDGRQYKTHKYYVTISKQLADDVCELGVKLGYSVRVVMRHPRQSYFTKINKCIIDKHPLYEIILMNGMEKELRSSRGTLNVSKKEHEGIVWCVQVPSGAIVVRRRGSVAIVGNCDIVMDESDKPGLQPSWREAVDANGDKINDWQQLGAIGESLGLTWGGHFKSVVDLPHFQYTGGLTIQQAYDLNATQGLEAVWRKIG